MTSDMVRKRISWIDTCKVFAIELVVFGHMYQYTFGSQSFLYHLIYSFHMPLFFLLSGLTINYDVNFFAFVKKKVSSLAKPYIILLILFLIKRIIKIIGTGDVFSISLYDTMLMTNQSVFSELWFLPTLFGAEIISYLILNADTINLIKILYSACALSIGLLLSMTRLRFPMCIDTGLFVSFYIVVGSVLKEWLLLFKDRTTIFRITYGVIDFAVFMAVNSYMFAKGSSPDFYYCLDLWNPIMSLVCGLTGSLAFIILLQRIPYTGLLENISKSTIYIYGLHYFVLSPVSRFFIRLNACENWIWLLVMIFAANVIVIGIFFFVFYLRKFISWFKGQWYLD